MKPSKRDAPGRVTFRVVNTHHQVDPDPKFVVLERDLWDDFGIKSSFRVFTCVNRKHERLGTWKIIDRRVAGNRLTDLPRQFEELPKRFVGLGQDLAAYERVAKLDRQLAITILRGLHDVVFQPVVGIEQLEAFNVSLIRFVDARDALRDGRSVLAARGIIDESSIPAVHQLPDELALDVAATLLGFATPHKLELRFSRRPQSLGVRRSVVLVGPNGSGKTQLLAVLARALSGLERKGVQIRPDRPFSRVLAVSYGAFDHFTTPRLRHSEISYVYCGLRTAQKVKSRKSEDQRIILDLEGALLQAAHHISVLSRGPRREAWRDALQSVQLSDSLDGPNLTEPASIADFLKHELSAGQKVVVLTLANLATYLETNSIVLHDEPETHLHPGLLSAMLRAIHGLLDRFDSHAIIATHSLVPLQETPSSNVFVIDQTNEGVISIDRPTEQCFAATLDEISRVAFRSQPNDENFRAVLKRLRQWHSLKEIRELLGGQLGLGTQMLLASLKQ